MRTLLIRPGAIGDFVLSLPAIECLRSEESEVWCAGQNVPLATRFADRAKPIAGTGLDWLGLPGAEPPPALIARLRSFDRIVSWYGAAQELFRRNAAELGLPFTFFPALPAEGGGHAADYYLQQVRSLQRCVESAVPRLPLPPTEREDFVVIHPFASHPRKRWPLDRFVDVGRRLRATGVRVHYCAGPEEPLEEAVRFDDLWELACWLAGARLFIGNDTGISHLAAAAGTPVIALFGPTDPRTWAPRGESVNVIERMDEVSSADLTRLAWAELETNPA